MRKLCVLNGHIPIAIPGAFKCLIIICSESTGPDSGYKQSGHSPGPIIRFGGNFFGAAVVR